MKSPPRVNFSEPRVIVPPALPIPSMAEQLDLRHLQAALEIAIELDRVNHLQASSFKMENSSFVMDVAKPLVAETEMSFMVERIQVPVPCIANQAVGGLGARCPNTREPVEECPPIPQSPCKEGTSEDMQSSSVFSSRCLLLIIDKPFTLQTA